MAQNKWPSNSTSDLYTSDLSFIKKERHTRGTNANKIKNDTSESSTETESLEEDEDIAAELRFISEKRRSADCTVPQMKKREGTKSPHKNQRLSTEFAPDNSDPKSSSDRKKDRLSVDGKPLKLISGDPNDKLRLAGEVAADRSGDIKSKQVVLPGDNSAKKSKPKSAEMAHAHSETKITQLKIIHNAINRRQRQERMDRRHSDTNIMPNAVVNTEKPRENFEHVDTKTPDTQAQETPTRDTQADTPTREQSQTNPAMDRRPRPRIERSNSADGSRGLWLTSRIVKIKEWLNKNKQSSPTTMTVEGVPIEFQDTSKTWKENLCTTWNREYSRLPIHTDIPRLVKATIITLDNTEVFNGKDSKEDTTFHFLRKLAKALHDENSFNYIEDEFKNQVTEDSQKGGELTNQLKSFFLENFVKTKMVKNLPLCECSRWYINKRYYRDILY